MKKNFFLILIVILLIAVQGCSSSLGIQESNQTDTKEAILVTDGNKPTEDLSNKQIIDVELHLYNEGSKKAQPELVNMFSNAADLNKFEKLFESLEPSEKLAVDKVQKVAMLAAHSGKNEKVEKRDDYLLVKLDDENLYIKKIIYSGTEYDFDKYSKEKNIDILKKAGLDHWSKVEPSQLPFSM